MGTKPSKSKGPQKPVENVSWWDCSDFLEKLNARISGPRFVLPTEAQWEYACRAGTTTKWNCGDDEDQVGEIAWLYPNAENATHRVGSRNPNAWGLYDMGGNVSEWCQDCYCRYPSSAVADPVGTEQFGTPRMIRGAGYEHPAAAARSAWRTYADAGWRGKDTGFRPARLVAP